MQPHVPRGFSAQCLSCGAVASAPHRALHRCCICIRRRSAIRATSRMQQNPGQTLNLPSRRPATHHPTLAQLHFFFLLSLDPRQLNPFPRSTSTLDGYPSRQVPVCFFAPAVRCPALDHHSARCIPLCLYLAAASQLRHWPPDKALAACAHRCWAGTHTHAHTHTLTHAIARPDYRY